MKPFRCLGPTQEIRPVRIVRYVLHSEAETFESARRRRLACFSVDEIEDGATFYLHEFPPGPDTSGAGDTMSR